MRTCAALLSLSLSLPSLAAPGVEIVPRATWDPDPPDVGALSRTGAAVRYQGPLERALSWIVVHHSDFTDAPGPLAIKRYHLDVSGFSDIGYHFVIAKDGTVYEGRHLSLMGAHAGASREQVRALVKLRKEGKKGRELDEAWQQDPDHGAIGIVLDGYFFGQRPTAAQQRSLALLVEELMGRYGIARDHVITHREVKPRVVEASGRALYGEETVCPGDELQAVVDVLRALLPGTP